MRRDPTRLNLAGLLNCLDGLHTHAAKRRIYILTTNNVMELSQKLTRSRRIDLALELSYMGQAAIREMFSIFFPESQVSLDTALQAAASRVHSFEELRITSAELSEALMLQPNSIAAIIALSAFLQARIESLAESSARSSCCSPARQQPSRPSSSTCRPVTRALWKQRPHRPSLGCRPGASPI